MIRERWPSADGAGARENGPDWRPVVAALANPHARRLFARITLGDAVATAEVGTSKERQAAAMLLRAGLVRDVDGRLVEQPDVFRRALSVAPRPRAGIERYLTESGEIDRYPSGAGERRELLLLLANRTLAVDEVVTESELNDRLARFGPDTAGLRRAMVDAEILERTRSGSEYALVPPRRDSPR